ncbi:MAG TPA: YbaY family lipoprotein, partial [Opitutaceae bacterium]
MKPFLGLFAAAATLALAGCGHLEPSPIGDPSRVLTGEVNLGDNVALPADTVVTVRILDETEVGQPPMVLGSQTVNNPGVAPISFRVEYRA